MTDEGSIDKHIGVEIDEHPNGSHELKHPYLIQRTIEGLNLSHAETQKRPTPVAKHLLYKDVKDKTRFKQWSYRSIIGMLIYL